MWPITIEAKSKHKVQQVGTSTFVVRKSSCFLESTINSIACLPRISGSAQALSNGFPRKWREIDRNKYISG